MSRKVSASANQEQNQTQNQQQSGAAAGRSGASEAALWPVTRLTIAWTEVCMQTWSAWLEMCGVNGAAFQAAQGGAEGRADDRREIGPAWLPKFESKLVPLNRREDQAGAEAAKVSMRVRVPALPWAAGSRSVIAIDTLMPRPTGSKAEVMPIKH